MQQNGPKPPTGPRRPCAKCGGNHMDWEHDFLDSNPTYRRPTKAYLIDVLHGGMQGYDQQDYEDCIRAYHAAQEEDISPHSLPYPGERITDSQDPYQYHTDQYPEIGGSSWFETSQQNLDQQFYDVPYHHAEIATQSGTGQPFLRMESTKRDIPPPKTIIQTEDKPRKSVTSPKIEQETLLHKCRTCNQEFQSRNGLHRHIKLEKHFAPEPDIFIRSGEPLIRRATMKPSLGTGFAFRGYTYAQVNVSTTPTGELHTICADSGCGMSVVDSNWLRDHYPQVHIVTMTVPIHVKGIGTNSHLSQTYVTIKMYIPGKDKEQDVVAEVEAELHLVQGLDCHILLGVDVLSPYGMVIDFH